ncbi:MAG: hypothetical protein LBU27_05880 [Candidatus Peribacteria bacterium]|nr:hypothetical protein [Candidatus Peribacteria bacterium]
MAVLDRLFQRLANNLPSSFTQEDYQRIYKKCYSIYEINPCETNISTLNILHSLSEKLFPTSIMSIMDEAAEIYIKQLGHQHHNAAPLFSSAISNPLYEYVDKLSKTNQEEIFLEELISLTDLSKKSILVSTYLFHCSRNSGSNLYKSIKTMVNNDNRLNACTKLLFCTESNYQGLYKSIF